MRELDGKNQLNADVIDGIMLEEKKEVDKVIISSQELSQYFGKEKTPREMKDQILKLLDDWAGKDKAIAKHPNFKHTAEADKRNEFDAARLIRRRLVLDPSEEYSVYEVDATEDADSIGEDENILNYDDVDDPDAFA